MIKDKIKFITGLLIAVVLAGCAISESNDVEYTISEGENAPYPIKTDVTLTCWMMLHGSAASTVGNFSETPLAKELEKQTGIKVEYIHSAYGYSQDVIMMGMETLAASGQYPDIMEGAWVNDPGSIGKAVQNGIIVSLNDYIEKYSPNLKKIMDEDDEIRSLSSYMGDLYVYPFIQNDEYLRTYIGLMLREDWLEDLGLSVPETIDEWENVLIKFKEEKGASEALGTPDFFIMSNNTPSFDGAFGVSSSFYKDDNMNVKYGPIQPEYKEYIKTMKRWYDLGLIDENFAMTTNDAVARKIIAGRCGATLGFVGSDMGRYLTAVDMVAAPYPTLKKGETSKFGHRVEKCPGEGMVISAQSKNKELAAMWLDYGYNKKGHMLMNFGIEGKSYEMQDGYPRYTDVITDNVNGLNMSQAMGLYMRSNYEGPFVQDRRYMEQYAADSRQQDAIKIWMNTDAKKHMLSRNRIKAAIFSAGGNPELFNILNEYRESMIVKFINGSESMENYDVFVETMREMQAVELAGQVKEGLEANK